MDTATVQAELATLRTRVAETLDVDPESIGPDTDLLATGRTDSLAIVNLLASNSQHFGANCLAVHAFGAIAVPVDPAAPKARLEFITRARGRSVAADSGRGKVQRHILRDRLTEGGS